MNKWTHLKMLRKQCKLTQRELGERIGVSPQAVRQAEQLGIRTITTAQRYAKALKCNPLDIIEL